MILSSPYQLLNIDYLISSNNQARKNNIQLQKNTRWNSEIFTMLLTRSSKHDEIIQIRIHIDMQFYVNINPPKSLIYFFNKKIVKISKLYKLGSY